jgi:hypothetical protein
LILTAEVTHVPGCAQLSAGFAFSLNSFLIPTGFVVGVDAFFDQGGKMLQFF